tara:strand:- start:3424 stop:5790 length:2367 start_codon:yes stop_codon:yes gene_type:complete
MNRFTQLTPARFNPLSWEETARVPLHKRTQHTAAETAAAELETAVAQLDALDLHTPRAKEIQEAYREKVDNLSSRLASEGINQNMTQEVLQLNSQLKQDFSPLGEAGQIMAAKKQEAVEKAAFFANADKSHSPEYLQRLWDTHIQKYSQAYNEGDNAGVVKNIDSLNAGKYYNIDKEVQDLFSKAGSTTQADIVNNGYTYDPTTGYFMNQRNEIVTSNNIAQLGSALKMMYNTYSNEELDQGRFAKGMGWTKDKLKEHLLNAVGVFTKVSNKEGDTIQTLAQQKPTTTKNNKKTTGRIFVDYTAESKAFKNDTSKGFENQITRDLASPDPKVNAAAHRQQNQYDSLKENWEANSKANKMYRDYISEGEGSLVDVVATENTITNSYQIANGQPEKTKNQYTVDELLDGINDSNGMVLDKSLVNKGDGTTAYKLIKNNTVVGLIPPELYTQAISAAKIRETANEEWEKTYNTYKLGRRSYHLYDLKGKNNESNKNLTRFLTQNTPNLTFDNVSVGKEAITDENDKIETEVLIRKLLDESDGNDKINVTYESITPDNGNNRPVMNFKIVDTSNENRTQTYQAAADIKDILGFKTASGKTTNWTSKGLAFMNTLAEYGGPEVNILKNNLEAREQFQDIVPTYGDFDPTQSNLIKSRTGLDQNLNIPANSELSIDQDKDGMYYFNVKGEDETTAALNWSHILNPNGLDEDVIKSSTTSASLISGFSEATTTYLVNTIKAHPQARGRAITDIPDSEFDEIIQDLASTDNINTNKNAFRASSHLELLKMASYLNK